MSLLKNHPKIFSSLPDIIELLQPLKKASTNQKFKNLASLCMRHDSLLIWSVAIWFLNVINKKHLFESYVEIVCNNLVSE